MKAKAPISRELTSPATEPEGSGLSFPFKPPGPAPNPVRGFWHGSACVKEEVLTMEGLIDEIYPDGRFGVMLDNEHRIIAYTAGKMRRFRIRSIVGDRVHVEMTPYDLSKGRIVYREKLAGSGGGGPPRRGNFRRR